MAINKVSKVDDIPEEVEKTTVEEVVEEATETKADSTQEEDKKFIDTVMSIPAAMGMSSFSRLEIDNDFTNEQLQLLDKQHQLEGYEVFSNNKTVLFLKS